MVIAEFFRKLRTDRRVLMLTVIVGFVIFGIVGKLLSDNGFIFGTSAGASLALPATVSTQVNADFTVPITLNPNNQNVIGVDVNLSIPRDKLQVTMLEAAANLPTTVTFIPSLSEALVTANQTGRLAFTALAYDSSKSATTQPITGATDVQLANITFKPLATGNAPVNWMYTANSTTDSNVAVKGSNGDQLTNVTNLAVTIATPPTPTPTLTATVTATPTATPTLTPTVTTTPRPSTTPAPTPTPSPTPTPTPEPPASTGDTAFDNAGFESGKISPWANAGATVVKTPHSGTYGVSINGNSNYVSTRLASNYVPDTNYTFSVWVKVTKAGTSWGLPALRISKFSDLGTSDFAEVGTANSTSAGWKQLKVTRKFTSKEIQNGIYIGVKNFGFNGTIASDDFAVTKQGGTTPTPTPTPVPTPSPTPTTRTVTFDATVSTQDGTQLTDAAWIGNAGSVDSSYTGLRFTNVTIPQSATIQSVKLEVQSPKEQWISLAYDLFGENSSNAASFSSSALISGRSLTSAKISHSSNEKWSSGGTYSLGDATEIIKSIISKSDWKSGNSLNLISKGTGSAFGRKEITKVKLTVTYTSL